MCLSLPQLEGEPCIAKKRRLFAEATNRGIFAYKTDRVTLSMI